MAQGVPFSNSSSVETPPSPHNADTADNAEMPTAPPGEDSAFLYSLRFRHSSGDTDIAQDEHAESVSAAEWEEEML
jgi:hypothetical protein